MTKRVGIAFFYDNDGVMDDYMIVLLKEMHKFVEKLILVSNGPLSRDSEIAARAVVDELLIRDNTGFDVAAYKHGLEHLTFEKLADYDELILFNHTFYGPIFPFSEMFEAMEKRECDFWGITAHRELQTNPFGGDQPLPYHINSHFIAVRSVLASSITFRQYWENIGPIESYEDSIVKHESRFTGYFLDLGYQHSVYIDVKDYGSYYPAFIDVDETIKNRCPILKRRAFYHDPMFHEENAIDLPRALELIKKTSDYDRSLIWKNILRSSSLRVLNNNACLTSIFPNVRLLPEKSPTNYGSVAVCAHVYYTEMLGELFELTDNIPVEYDFIATTDSVQKKEEIEAFVAGRKGVKKVIVRIMDVNRGRDMAALFITCRDLFMEDQYDLVCRLHTKKSPQVMMSRSNVFKRHMFENLLLGKGYVSNVLDMFRDNPWIGLAVPPIVQISYWTFGHSWYGNQARVEDIRKTLGLKVTVDSTMPVAAYGTMFWFRPKALRKMFAHEWKYTDFNPEPNHVDGGLAHGIERTIAYVAQDAGYITQHICNTSIAAWNYTMMEFKLDSLQARLPLAHLGFHVHMLAKWQRAGYPYVFPPTSNVVEVAANSGVYVKPLSVKRALRELGRAIRRSFRKKTSRAA